MTAAARRLLVIVAVALLVLGGCGGGDDGDDGDDATEGTDGSGEASVPDPLDAVTEPASGEGVIVLGFEELTFTVTDCAEGPRPDDTPEATLDHSLDGEGETDEGSFTVLVTRYTSDTGAGEPVVTETARIVFGTGDDQRGVEAKRTTAGPGGAWLDLADPGADGPLIARQGDAYDARGTFGPIAARAGDDGLQEGRLRATCPT